MSKISCFKVNIELKNTIPNLFYKAFQLRFQHVFNEMTGHFSSSQSLINNVILTI